MSSERPAWVSCVIPAYNEAETVQAVVCAALACREIDEVIVVSDGSSDETARRACEAGAHEVIVLDRNQGKANAILAAARRARGHILLLLDADLLGLRSSHLSQLLSPVLSGGADMSVAVFAGDPRHLVLSRFSGQRAVLKSLLDAPEMLSGTGFGFEMALDRVAGKAGARVVRVTLGGLGHRPKVQKYGLAKGLRLQLKASTDVFQQARRRRPGRRRKPKRQPRSVPMTPPFLSVVPVLAAASGPFSLVRPHLAPASNMMTLQGLGPTGRLLVVVAHPDDEVAGAGGLIAEARRLGAAVGVLMVTNGESNRVSAAILNRRLPTRPHHMLKTGDVRQREAIDGMRRLGVDADAVVFLGFPDRVLEKVLSNDTPVRSPYTLLDHATGAVFRSGAPYTGTTLRALTAEAVARFAPTVIVTHAPFDRHGDHRTTYAVVRDMAPEAPVYSFLVHAPNFPRPLRSSRRSPLLPPAHLRDMPGWSWARFDLSDDAQARKQDAINAHRSQVDTPYLRFLLASFVRTNELFCAPV